MAEERPLYGELRDTQERLREARQFQEQTLEVLSEMKTRLSYQQDELLKITKLLNADGNQGMVTRLHLLERDVKDLEDGIKDQSAWSKQIKLALIVSVLGLVSSFLSPWLQKHFSAPTQSPVPEWFDPGPGESMNLKAIDP